ncbi:Caspase domain-containing protein [Nocardia amikacinitolerans]|uniref:Caspase domain-containing protein n=1 Tax=Nocardia amikacinitolerans TaxID=756689 RepID=A0A285KZF8_9NOCA|nr:caspase family protein [Nocardia amikacinitolerans]SNY78042.1 Caspase domain-containing protein [Nocardia amikacinitolerans]
MVADKRSALIVACDNYQDPGLRMLRAPTRDAEALADVLRNPLIGGFEVRISVNEPAHVISERVEEFFADRGTEDLLLLHFSCHGVKDEGGELYFAAANTKLTRLGATGVAAAFVNHRMNRSRSRRIVLLLDCCYAGAFERGMAHRAGAGMNLADQLGGRGRAVITASSAMEYSFESGQLADTADIGPSVFTGALVNGLATGKADRNQDGLITLDELYDYVYAEVRATSPNQTPGKWVFGAEGELCIARRSRRLSEPPPLPVELSELIDSPLPSARAVAVRELEKLLHGRHLGRAEAAQQGLRKLADDDSHNVSTAAAAALQGDKSRPDLSLGPPIDEQPRSARIHARSARKFFRSRLGLLTIGAVVLACALMAAAAVVAIKPWEPDPTAVRSNPTTIVSGGDTTVSQNSTDSVPAEYVGTWAGVTSDQFGLSFDVRVTLRSGRVGEEVGTLSNTAQFLSRQHCESRLLLKSVSSTGLTLEDRLAENNPQCADTRSTVVLDHISEDSLEYKTTAATGEISGTLRRQ